MNKKLPNSIISSPKNISAKEKHDLRVGALIVVKQAPTRMHVSKTGRRRKEQRRVLTVTFSVVSGLSIMRKKGKGEQ